MLNLTRLLCNVSTEGDSLRYGERVSLPNAPTPQAWIHRRPIVVWNTTRKCNLHCIHCYTASQDTTYPGELSTEEGYRLIDSLARYQVPVLLFSGGEPLSRPDVLLLAARAVERGLRVVFSTNGTLMTPAVARELKTLGASYVGISLDGASPAANDRFRGKKGAFQEALAGIHICQEAGLKVGLRFTITRANFQEVPALFDLVVREGIPRLCFYHLVYSGRGSNLMDTVLSHEESREVVDLVFDRTVEIHRQGHSLEVLTVDNHADAAYLYLRLLREDPQRAAQVLPLLQRNGGNSSGVGIANVDNLGYVHPDQFWQQCILGNVRDRDFAEIWEDTSHPILQVLKERDGFIQGRCQRCRFFDICNGNFRVRAQAVYDNPWAEDPACYLTDAEAMLPQGQPV